MCGYIMDEYIDWLTNVISRKLDIPTHVAMGIAKKTDIGFCPGYLVGDYLDVSGLMLVDCKAVLK